MTFITLMSSCAPQNEEAFHTSRSAASSNLSPSHWSTNSFPLQLRISSDFNNDESEAIGDMADQWSASVNDEIQFFDTTNTTSEKNTSNINAYNDGTMGVYKLTTWPSEFPGTALAVTQIFGTKRNNGSYIQINHADIMVNYANFSFSTDYGFGYDLQTVILHEMGHFLGLYHDTSSVDESIMYPTISRFKTNREPLDRDISNVEDKYNVHGGAVAANRYLIPRQVEKDDSPGIPVVIVFELYPGGKEKVYMKERK